MKKIKKICLLEAVACTSPEARCRGSATVTKVTHAAILGAIPAAAPHGGHFGAATVVSGRMQIQPATVVSEHYKINRFHYENVSSSHRASNLFSKFLTRPTLKANCIIELRREKTGLQGFRPGLTQIDLYSHRKELEA